MKPIELFVTLCSPELEVIPYSMENGCYSAVTPDKASRLKLLNLGEQLGFDINPDKLHITVIYSEKPVSDPKVKSGKFAATCREVGYWTGHDGKTYVVAKINSDELHAEHQRLRSLGAEHSFPDYSPHVTLDASEGELSKKLKKSIDEVNGIISRYPMELIFENQFIGDLKD